MLVSRNGRADTLTVRARVIDPSGGLDEPASLTMEEGVITAIDAVGSAKHASGSKAGPHMA